MKVFRRYGIPVIGMTLGQRMVLAGIREEDVESIWTEPGMTVGQAAAPCVHYVRACSGTVTADMARRTCRASGSGSRNCTRA
ncbi:sulfite reductase, assimilatory-type [hydrocarbon metagenome]|uniref:Sulfite reductase, assimilatory-type n=1 Tax=hydrocarbon metagenome TaxID=938273 RepID=A0A0W8FIP1_9ZZZZ|nr:hypothetical protein [Methanomicrobiaceae archaeon]